jgi:hypothetical protein
VSNLQRNQSLIPIFDISAALRTDVANSVQTAYAASTFPSTSFYFGAGTYTVTCSIKDKWGAVTETAVAIVQIQTSTTDLGTVQVYMLNMNQLFHLS